MASYSNFRAFRAMVKASLQSILKSPSAIFFGIGFPLVFILVFGLLGGGGGNYNIHIASAPGSDTNNAFYQSLHYIPVLVWDTVQSKASEEKALSEGDITASILIKQQPEGVQPKYKITVLTAVPQSGRLQQLRGILNEVIKMQDPEITKKIAAIAELNVQELQFKEYKNIDFVLPGQLGFSLLSGSIFGTAFVFYNMRNTLVLKRFFATPVRREIIVLSEGTARMLFQLLSAIIIIGVGHYAFDFTLSHGVSTFIQLLVLSVFGIMVFMALGFIVSGVVKSDASIPMFANLIVLPQAFLAGTFFPIDSFPSWIKPVCKALPLTYMNDAMRKIGYDGQNLWDVRLDLLILLGFGVVFYFIAGKTFKWE